MRLLLDTHVFLWWQTEDIRLVAAVRDQIRGANEVHVSAATAWEITIKQTLGKLEGVRGAATIGAAVAEQGFLELPVSVAHAERVLTLPLHHRDPFDRLLVAQSMCEDLALVTHDRPLAAYGVPIVWT